MTGERRIRPIWHLASVLAMAALALWWNTPRMGTWAWGWWLGGIALALFLLRAAFRNERVFSFASPLLADGGWSDSPSPGWKGWIWAGAGFFILCFAILQFNQPFYFTQDDNFAQFLPVMREGCRSLFAEGIFPVWNPYQFLGAPVADVGVYALTYPPTWLSYLIARYLLGDANAMLEVFAFLHLLGGYFAAYWLGRRVGIRRFLAALLGCSHVLCGWQLFAGRGWYYMLPLAFYLPLLGICLVRLARGAVGWRWVLGTGLVIGALFHAGNAQMWVYTVMFFALALSVLTLSRALPWKRALLGGGSAFLCGVGFAAPLLWPQFLVTANVLRKPEGFGGAMGWRGLLDTFLPPFLGPDASPEVYTNGDLSYAAHRFDTGTALALGGVLALLGILGMLAARRVRRGQGSRGNMTGAVPGLVLAGTSLLFSLGHPGVLWSAFSYLPVFSSFTHPYKFSAFFTFILLLMGGAFWERVLRSFRLPRTVPAVLGLAAAGLLLFHASQSRLAAYLYADRPYPDFPPAVERHLREEGGRVLAVAPLRSGAPGFPLALSLAFATAYRVPVLDGYDRLVGATGENRGAKRQLYDDPELLPEYGVRWMLVSRYAISPLLSGVKAVESVEKGCDPLTAKILEVWIRKQVCLDPLVDVDKNMLFDLGPPLPLAFTMSRSFPLRMRWDGVDVEIPAEGSDGLTVNFLWRPAMEAFQGGRRLPLDADSLGRMVIPARLGAGMVRIRYRPPWGGGFLLGLVLLASASVYTWLGRRWMN